MAPVGALERSGAAWYLEPILVAGTREKSAMPARGRPATNSPRNMKSSIAQERLPFVVGKPRHIKSPEKFYRHDYRISLARPVISPRPQRCYPSSPKSAPAHPRDQRSPNPLQLVLPPAKRLGTLGALEPKPSWTPSTGERVALRCILPSIHVPRHCSSMSRGGRARLGPHCRCCSMACPCM